MGGFEDLKRTMGPFSGAAFRRWWVDPGGGRLFGRGRRFSDEAFRVLPERLVEGDLARRVNGVDLSVMYLVWSHQANSGMVMLLIVPNEERATETSGVLASVQPKRLGKRG